MKNSVLFLRLISKTLFSFFIGYGHKSHGYHDDHKGYGHESHKSHGYGHDSHKGLINLDIVFCIIVDSAKKLHI